MFIAEQLDRGGSYMKPGSVEEPTMERWDINTQIVLALILLVGGVILAYMLVVDTNLNITFEYPIPAPLIFLIFFLSFFSLWGGIYMLLISLEDYLRLRRAEKIKDIKSLLKLKRVQLKRGLPKEIKALEQELEKLEQNKKENLL